MTFHYAASLQALALALHQTRTSNEAPEYDMTVAMDRAAAMMKLLEQPRLDSMDGVPHRYTVDRWLGEGS